MNQIVSIIKTTIAVCILTLLMISFLALLLYKFHFNDNVIHTSIMIIYFLANFLGGFLIGKAKNEKKFVWGLLTGITYFILLSLISFIVTRGFYSDPASAFFAFLACCAGGIFGGMLA